MAEVVEEMQERLLPEYEQMQKYQICTDAQLRECMLKRNKFQIRITKNQKTMRDFLDFIIFERKVHKWVCEKEEVIGKKLTGLKALIAKRILRLYRDGLKRFPNEERLWRNFIQFSKKSAPHEVVSIYENMLTFYGDKENIWCETGLWAYEYGGNMSKVKEIFFRALLRHPKSEIIHKSFFDLLLVEAAKMSDEKNLDNDTKSEQDIGLQLVQLAYADSKKNIKNLNYFLSLLERCEEAKYANITIMLQKEIVDDLMETYAKEELLWDALAQRELRGFSTSDLSKELPKNSSNEISSGDQQIPKIIWLHRTERQRIELCCKVYETAVQALPTEKMWTFYINAMLKLNQDADTELPLKRKRLALAFKSGEESQLLSDAHLDAYVRMLLISPTGIETAKNVLEKLGANRSSLKFFELWLLLYIVEKNETKVEEIFRKANSALGVASITLWKRVIDFYKSQGNIERVCQMYKEASQQTRPQFAIFRADYLAYCLETSSLDKTRKIYNDQVQLPPPCLEMLQKMLEIETKVNPRDSERLRLYHENIVHYFGKTNPEVWLDFLKFEREHEKPQNVSLLYNRAKATLEPHLADIFIAEHTFLISKS